MNVAAGEGLEALAVSELDIQHPAVCVDEREGIQFARVPRVTQRAEVAPVDFETLPSQRLHAHECSPGRNLWPDVAHICLQDAVPPAVTKWTQSLFDHSGTDRGIFLQPLGDVALEGVEFGGTNARCRALRRRIEILPDRLPSSDGARSCGWASARTSTAGAGR